MSRPQCSGLHVHFPQFRTRETSWDVVLTTQRRHWSLAVTLSGRGAIFQLGLGPSAGKGEAIDYILLLGAKKVEIIQTHKNT